MPSPGPSYDEPSERVTMVTPWAANHVMASCRSEAVPTVAMNSSAAGAMSLTISATATPCWPSLPPTMALPAHNLKPLVSLQN
ncbi:MAG TPA: hypothetical protein DCQ52_09405 [Acidimicrobiaceae bacterium]|nr:hypothetical protein [Acidimicrobiaceae bacterium]